MGDLTKSLEALSPKKRALLELLRKEQRAERSRPGIVPRSNFETLPLSFAQQRLWFLSESHPDSAAYNVAAGYRLAGSLDLEALEKSFSEIGRRHEVLRATFEVKDGEPLQRIDAAQKIALRLIDLHELPETQREAEAVRLASEDAVTPFDLRQGPLVRATLFKISPECHVLQMTLHHIACDGWSIGVFFREMAELYSAFSVGRTSPLPELAIQYADYADWQRASFSEEGLKKQLSYWTQQLADAVSLLRLPSDRARPAVQSLRGERKTHVLPAGLTTRLKAFAEEHGVTSFVLMLAAFQAFLHRESGQADIMVGSPVSGRTRTELEPLIGFFANILPLRMNFSDDPTVLELLRRTRETVLEAEENKDVPFEKLVDELGFARDTSYSPVFQAGFAFHVSTLAPTLPGMTCTRLEMDTKTSKWDITLEVLEEAGLFSCIFEYSTDLFNDSTVSRMSRHFEALLEKLVAAPKLKVSELPLLTANECHEILQEWNQTARVYPREKSLQELFEVQVERSPEAVAVVFGEERVSYGELNRRANQLAWNLKKRGVEPGGLVGVCLERSAEMVVALLAILKAGGAYVPLDPTYPEERLKFMLVDTQAPVVIAEEATRAGWLEDWGEVVWADRQREEIAAESDANPECQRNGESLAYVMYTSGSTGTPKGIEIRQRSISRLVLNTDYVQLGPEDHCTGREHVV